MNNVEQVTKFFKNAIKQGKKAVAGFVVHADHEFNSQVVFDEASAKWQVTKEVQETGLFDSEQEAIDWSTQPIGTRAPSKEVPGANAMTQERTPLKEPISTDEVNLPNNQPLSQPTQDLPQPEGGMQEKTEASDFIPVAKSKVRNSFGNSDVIKGLADLEILGQSLRRSGNTTLATKIDKLREDTYQANPALSNDENIIRQYVRAWKNSLRRNIYAGSDYREQLITDLNDNFYLSREQSIQLLDEENFPQQKEIIPNYFD